MKDIYEKSKNSFYGFLVGDALGVPVEFTNRESLEKDPVVDMQGYGSHNVPDGTWSDDSSMVLAEMDSIGEKNDIDYDDIMLRFIDWFSKAYYTSTGVVFDIGVTTRKALFNYRDGFKATECGGKSLYDNVNGALMRMLPFVIYSYQKELSEEDEVLLIKNTSQLTHGHEINQVGCKIYFDFMKRIFDGDKLEDIYNDIKNKDYTKFYSRESVDCYKRILNNDIKNLNINDIKSSGFVVSTLEACIWCLLNSTDYQSAVLEAVNLGDDTDTVAAITGSLAGAYYNDVPQKWVDKIRNKELADNIFSKYYVCFNDDYNNAKRL